MTREEAEREMTEGYLDGFKGEPKPGENRSRSYRHGYANGCDDRMKKPRASAAKLREVAEIMIGIDVHGYHQ